MQDAVAGAGEHLEPARAGRAAGDGALDAEDVEREAPLGDVIEAEFTQLCRDEGCGAPFLEAEFGMCVQVTPPEHHLLLQRITVELRHFFSPS